MNIRTDKLSSGVCAAAVCCAAVALLGLPDRADAQYQGKAAGQPESEAIKAPPAQSGVPNDPCTEVKTQAVKRDGGTRAKATGPDPFIFRMVGRPPPPTGPTGE